MLTKKNQENENYRNIYKQAYHGSSGVYYPGHTWLYKLQIA